MKCEFENHECNFCPYHSVNQRNAIMKENEEEFEAFYGRKPKALCEINKFQREKFKQLGGNY